MIFKYQALRCDLYYWIRHHFGAPNYWFTYQASGETWWSAIDRCRSKRIDIADHAELYLAHRPGTDVMLINGVMQQIIKHGWYDQVYRRSR